MARGAPDYQTLVTETVIKDLDEISVDVSRTGFARIDGGGRVVWFDDFSMGATRVYAYATSGGTAPYTVVEDRYMYGLSPSLKFNPVANTGQCVIDGLAPLPRSGKIGFEFGMYLQADHGELLVTFAPFIEDGSNEGFLLKMDAVTDGFSVYVDNGYTAVYAPSNTSLFEDRLIAVKMVVDPSTQKYERIFLGANKFDIPYNGRSNYVGGAGGGAVFSIDYHGTGANNKSAMYLGYVLVTADEQ